MTRGENVLGLDFNPSNLKEVTFNKRSLVNMYDFVEDLIASASKENSEKIIALKLAQHDLDQASMRITKALTRFQMLEDNQKEVLWSKMVEFIAMSAHTAIAKYRESIGQEKYVHWRELSEELKNSSKKGVQFWLDNPDKTARDQHIQWCVSKQEDGWSYGEIKDVNNKKHPCLVEYEALPEIERKKDEIFREACKYALHSFDVYFLS